MLVLQCCQLKIISFNQNSEYTSLLHIFLFLCVYIYIYISIIIVILIQGYIIHTLVAEIA